MQEYNDWRLVNSAGIRYKMVSQSGSFGYESANAQEEYIIRSSDLLNFVLFAFPSPIVSGSSVSYPQQPVMPGLGTLVPSKVSYKSHEPGKPVDPFGADPTAPEGTYSKYLNVTVQYGTSPENDQPQDPSDEFTFLEVSARASGVFLNAPLKGTAEWELLPNSAFEITVVDGEQVETGESTEVKETNVPHTVIETQVEWSIRWNRIPWTFWSDTLMARLRGKLGKVNAGPMRLFHKAPAETILFLSYDVEQEHTWRSGLAGQSPISLEMKFLEKNFTVTESYLATAGGGTETTEIDINVTHQHIFRPSYGWRKLKINGNYLYNAADLETIWRP